jgi:glutamate-1-semialdehyde 2,1-aminomutase
MTVFFGPIEVRNFDDANRLDRERFARFFRLALDGGVLLPPSPFEALFLMEAHGEVVDEALETLVQALRESR